MAQINPEGGRHAHTPNKYWNSYVLLYRKQARQKRWGWGRRNAKSVALTFRSNIFARYCSLKLWTTIMAYNKSRTTQDHNLKKLQWALVPNATYQVSLQSTNQPIISVEEDITIYGCGSPLGHVTKIIQNNFCFPDHRRLLFHGDTYSQTVP